MIFFYHIRRRLLSKGGRPLDFTYSRFNGTYCGSEPTSFDIAVYDRVLPWKRQSDGQLFNPCAACVEKKLAYTLK